MVAGMLGAMLLFFGRQENIPALKWWGTAYLLGAASVAIWTIGGPTLGETLSLALNAVGFVACGMVWNASRVFHGRKPNLPGLVLGAIAWIGAAVALPSPGSRDAPDRSAPAIVAVYAALTASELWTERRRAHADGAGRRSRCRCMHGCVLMLPILLGDLLRPHDDTFSSSIWVTVFSIELVLYAIGTVFVIFMLVSDRAVTVHKTAASIDPLDRHVQPPRLCRSTVAGDRARSRRRPAGDGDDLRHRPFQVDQRPFRPSGGRRDPQTVLDRRDQQPAHQRSVGTDRRRGVRGAAAVLAGRGRARGRTRARGVRGIRASCARTGRSIPPSASAWPADRRAPNSKCCWRRPTPRSIRPSAAAAIASRPRRNCRCRWKTGGARPQALRARPLPQPGVAPVEARRGGNPAVYHSIDIIPAMDSIRTTKSPGRPDVARSCSRLGARRFCLHVLHARTNIETALISSAARRAATAGSSSRWPADAVRRLRADGRRHGAAVQLSLRTSWMPGRREAPFSLRARPGLET